MYFIFLIGGLALIFRSFDKLDIKTYQQGLAKYGPKFRPKFNVMKIGYLVMFAYFAILSVSFSGTYKSSGDDYDPCGSSMKC